MRRMISLVAILVVTLVTASCSYDNGVVSIGLPFISPDDGASASSVTTGQPRVALALTTQSQKSVETKPSLAMEVLPVTATFATENVVCPESIASGKENVWERPNAHPYTGGVEGVKYFQIPNEVKKAFKEMVKNGSSTRVTLKKGDVFCGMLYSKVSDETGKEYHHEWKNVTIGDWPSSGKYLVGANLYSMTYNGYVYELVKPDVCKNLAYRVLSVELSEFGRTDVVAPKKLPSPAASVTQRVAEAEKEATEVPPTATISDNNVYRQCDKNDKSLLCLRVRFWDWSSIPSELQKEIQRVNANESDLTYPFKDGAVSRDLNDKLIESFKKGAATTIGRCITAEVKMPGSERQQVQACPGDHSKYPKLVFWEAAVDRELMRASSARFEVVPIAPEGCSIVYPRFDEGRGERLLSSRDGEVASIDSSAANFNVIADCSKSSG